MWLVMKNFNIFLDLLKNLIFRGLTKNQNRGGICLKRRIWRFFRFKGAWQERRGWYFLKGVDTLISSVFTKHRPNLTSFQLFTLFLGVWGNRLSSSQQHTCPGIVTLFSSWNKWEYVLKFSVTPSFTWPFNCSFATSWLTLGHQWEHMLSQLHLGGLNS